jgi:hypothetical protein
MDDDAEDKAYFVNHPIIMDLTYKKFPETPEDMSENDLRACSSLFHQITGKSANENRLKPWKGRVVRITKGDSSVYRLLKGHGGYSLPDGVCWMRPKTQSQLDVHDGNTVRITTFIPQWIGRLSYYNNHLDDTVRFTFRIGFWGLILAVLGVGLAILIPMLANSR